MSKRLHFLTSGRRRKAIELAILAAVAFAGPLPALADDAQDDSQALTAETNAALMQAGNDANAALEQLMAARGALVTASSTEPSRILLVNVPADLKQPINLSWNGPADSLASKVALAIGYKFVVEGTKPVAPPVVTMVFQNEPAIWVLQRLGIRIRDGAQVNVHAADHEIQYRYNVASQGLSGGIAGGFRQ
jgi:DotD protein